MINILLHGVSFEYGVLLIATMLVVLYCLRRWQVNRDIARLGGRAPRIRTVLPLGIDFIWNAVQAFRTWSGHEFWYHFFKSSGGMANGSWTAEGNARVVFTADPENIKAALATQFTDYGKGERFHDEWSIFLGDGIFTTDGALWHDARQLIRPMFVRERVGDLDLFETYVQKLLSFMGPGDGRLIRFDKLLFRFSLDTATDILFGKSVGSLENQASDFAQAFDEVQSITALRSRAGVFRHLLPQGRLRRSLRIVESFIEPLISQVLVMTPEELDQKLSKSDTFIHALARFTRDRKVIRDQLVSILLAGRDTTASTLSWVFLELARNPQVVIKLLAEIEGHLGSNGRLPTYRDIKDMKYLTNVINETLRLYPTVPFNIRTSITDTTLPKGGGPDGTSPIGLKAQTPVGYSTLVMHRRRDLYPPISKAFPYEPLEWVPERWDTWQPTPWQFIPFNGGPRICIGQQFAMVEMAYTITRILQTYDFIKDYGNKPLLKCEIVLTPGEGVKIGFVKSGLEKASE